MSRAAIEGEDRKKNYELVPRKARTKNVEKLVRIPNDQPPSAGGWRRGESGRGDDKFKWSPGRPRIGCKPGRSVKQRKQPGRSGSRREHDWRTLEFNS
jgi:hypothetical protein